MLGRMSDFFLLFVLALPIALAAVFLSVWKRKPEVLKKRDALKLSEEIERLESRSANERIVGYDKVLDHLLTSLGYRGTLADKLKRKPRILGNRLEEVWKLHKIRNRVVHELTPVSGTEIHADKYRKILLELLSSSR